MSCGTGGGNGHHNKCGCPKDDKGRRYRHHRHHGHHRHQELDRVHTQLRYFRPVAILFSLVFLTLLTWLTDFNVIVIIMAVVFILREIFQLLFLVRLQNRILKPVKKLKTGIEAVSSGNFDVTVVTDVDNEFKDLSAAFNKMTRELKVMDETKKDYEENRKNLLASITHDIKTPLSSIQGYMETINEGVVKDQETLKRYNEIILNNVVYTNKLIDDLFLFSKLDLDKVNFNFDQVSAKDFFLDMMNEIQFEVEELGYQWGYKDGLTGDEVVDLDGKRIHQSIRNVVGNAIKYGAGDDLKIDVATSVKDCQCLIEIHDNGPGIDDSHLDAIFQRFYRIDKARTKDTMSTGLGLAITKEFIEAHEGTIAIDSALGEGTTITICLPLTQEVA